MIVDPLKGMVVALALAEAALTKVEVAADLAVEARTLDRHNTAPMTPASTRTHAHAHNCQYTHTELGYSRSKHSPTGECMHKLSKTFSSLLSRMDARNLLHLRDEASPVVLLGEVHAHICPVPVDGADQAHTLMRDRTPLVPEETRAGEGGGMELRIKAWGGGGRGHRHTTRTCLKNTPTGCCVSYLSATWCLWLSGKNFDNL